MIIFKSFLFVLLIATISAAPNPTPDPVIIKKEGLRYDYEGDGEGNLHLLDRWMKLSDIMNAARYNPDIDNVLHLFTRDNPTVSQPMLFGTSAALAASNFSPNRRTAIVIHGFTESATSAINTVLVPALLGAEDLNVFVYDWNAGASVLQAINAANNAVEAGRSLARTIDWICSQTGASPDQFHLLGFSLGTRLAGVAGRNVQQGRIAYITALDPPPNTLHSDHPFGPDVATYTESIHTGAVRIDDDWEPFAHSEFYPNGGNQQPGCGINFLCSHYRSYHFFAETVSSTSDWAGTRCDSYMQARLGLCDSNFTLRMGGLTPKVGSSGLYHLRTNAVPPFQPYVDTE